MSGQPTLLKALLLKRHQQTHTAFRLEYEKVARGIDRNLIGSAPSREAFSRWIRGDVKTKPHAGHCRVLERMFPGHTVAELLSPYDAVKKVSDICEQYGKGQEAATNRREMFQLGAVTMTAGLLDNALRGPDLLEQLLDSTTVSEARLHHLETEADRLGQKVPPTSLLSEALLYLASVRELLSHRQPLDTHRRLACIGSKLSIVVGEIMFCANQYPLARRWFAAATRAADEAGDRALADLALASTALIPTYSADPNGTLALVFPRLDLQGVAATPALAWMWGFAALAYATLGDRDAFERAVNRSRMTLGRCAPNAVRPGILSFQPERLTFYEARGRADLGDLPGTAEAANRALAVNNSADSSSDPALVRFAYACALAKSGEIEEACHLATTAIRDPNIAHNITVVVRAHEFDALLDHSGSATGDWREALAEIRSPDPTMFAASSLPRT